VKGGGSVDIRDHDGRFLAGACHFFPSLQEPEDAKLQACRQAMAIAKQLKLQRVVLETDSMAMVSKLTAIEAPEGCHFFPSLQEHVFPFADVFLNS
jgi:hypothetical protein